MALIQCPECKKEISDHAKKCPHCGYPIKKTSRNLAIFIFSGILIASCAVVWLATKLISSGNETQIAEATNPPDTTTNATETQITVLASSITQTTEVSTQKGTDPESGRIFRGYEIWMDIPGLFGTPITINASEIDHTNNYYIKLISDQEQFSGYKGHPYTLEFFLRGREETTVYAPDGNYTIHYAVGKNWYGIFDLFGDNTQYYKLGQVITCEYNDDTGYTIELDVEDGNIVSEKISAEVFKICSNTKNPSHITLDEAISSGRGPCSKCYSSKNRPLRQQRQASRYPNYSCSLH